MGAFFKFLFVNLGFFILTCYMVVRNEMQKIKNQWPLYRCNPAYMFMADNIAENFEYCISQSGASAFNKFSGKLSEMQIGSLKGQSTGTDSLSAYLKANNKSNSGFASSLSSIMDMGGKYSILGAMANIYSGDIFDKVGGTVSTTGDIYKSGYDGASVTNNMFGTFIKMFAW